MRTGNGKQSKIRQTFAKIYDWLFTPNHVPAYGHVRVSGTRTVHRTFELPVRFVIEGRIISSTGRVTYLCMPTPRNTGDLEWVEPDSVRIGNDLQNLVRAPSVCKLADPILFRGELHYPAGGERSHIKFTVYAE